MLIQNPRPFGFVIQMFLLADLKSAIIYFRIANPKERCFSFFFFNYLCPSFILSITDKQNIYLYRLFKLKA